MPDFESTVHKSWLSRPVRLGFPAVLARARRAATRALPERGTLACGCNDHQLCPEALELWRAYFRLNWIGRAERTHDAQQAAFAEREEVRKDYERHRKGGKSDSRGALRPSCGACAGQNPECEHCGMAAVAS